MSLPLNWIKQIACIPRYLPPQLIPSHPPNWRVVFLMFSIIPPHVIYLHLFATFLQKHCSSRHFRQNLLALICASTLTRQQARSSRHRPPQYKQHPALRQCHHLSTANASPHQQPSAATLPTLSLPPPHTPAITLAFILFTSPFYFVSNISYTQHIVSTNTTSPSPSPLSPTLPPALSGNIY